MIGIRKHQTGGSAIVNLVFLALAAFAIFVAVQYVPHMIESTSVDSMLETLEENQQSEPVSSTAELKTRIGNLLYVNQKQEMKNSFHVRKSGSTFFVKVSYERDLNLGYTTKKLEYRKSLVLN